MARPTRLDDAAVSQWLASHAGWAREGDVLTKTYTLADFPSAIGFVTKVALLAEKLDHHPDITINFRKVTLRYSTHDAGGLTTLDLQSGERADGFA